MSGEMKAKYRKLALSAVMFKNASEKTLTCGHTTVYDMLGSIPN
jgi:hypothetical protein